MEFKVERLQKESMKQSNALNETEGQLLQANKLKKEMERILTIMEQVEVSINDFKAARHDRQNAEKEIEKITSFLRVQGNPDYIEEITQQKKSETNDGNINDSDDDLYQTAIQIVKTEKKASTSFLQRKLQIGYNRAARMIDQMEESGIVSKANHTGKREVL